MRIILLSLLLFEIFTLYTNAITDNEIFNEAIKSIIYKDYAKIRARRSSSRDNIAQINAILFDRSISWEQQWDKWRALPQEVRNDQSLRYQVDPSFLEKLHRAYDVVDHHINNAKITPHIKELFFKVYVDEQLKNTEKYKHLPEHDPSYTRLRMASENAGAAPIEEKDWRELLSLVDAWEDYMDVIFPHKTASTQAPAPETEPPTTTEEATEPPTTEEVTELPTEEMTEPPPTWPPEDEETTTYDPSIYIPTIEPTEEPGTILIPTLAGQGEDGDGAMQEPEAVVGSVASTRTLFTVSLSFFFYLFLSKVLSF